MPAVLMWLLAITFALFFVQIFVQLNSAYTSPQLPKLHPVAKRIITIHLAGLIVGGSISFFAGCAWMVQRTKAAIALSAISFMTVAIVAWNCFRLALG